MALLRRTPPGAPPVPRKDRRGRNPLWVGAIVLVLVVIGLYFGFSKHVPFTHGFRVNAVFQNANSVRPNSPVRIAGVNVGKVTGVQRYKDTDASVVTMDLDAAALPIHKDAEFKIRPRIFLEGNFFVDVHPGTPTSPVLADGDTVPLTQTASPVQLGDVLTALQGDTRRSLQQTLVGYGRALTRTPTAADDATAAPSSRGKTAAQSLNENFDYAAPAFKGTALVNQAFLGIEPNDLGRLISSLSTVSAALDRNERQLQDFVSNFAATTKIFADESTNLRTTIRELSPTLRTTNTLLGHLNADFPATRAFAREILPGVRATPATIAASFPWIRQTRALLQPSELQGTVRALSPATRDLAAAINGTTTLLPQTNLTSKCIARVILPTGDIHIEDGPLTTGVENYKEFWYAMVGLAGEGENFDGNGQYVRFQTGAGDQTVSTGRGLLSGEKLFGRDSSRPLGNRPERPAQNPPYKPGVPCYRQKLPNLNGAVTGPPDASQTIAPPAVGSTPLTIPGLTATAATSRSPAPPSGGRDDVAAQLLDRLNPFRSGAGR